MRLCSLNNLEENMILGKSLYETNGKLLLGAGFRINTDMKNKLAARGYSHLYVMEEGTEDVIPEDVISDEIKLQSKMKLAGKISEIEKQEKLKDVSLSKAKELIEKGYLREVNIAYAMKSIVEEILKDISASGASFMNMVMVKNEETYFFDHALNCTVLAILIGKKYRFTRDELKALALGTFLHDIGKVILNQIEGGKSKILPENLYNEHPTFGYLILNSGSSGSVSPMETQIVNQHHEYQDGGGFPIGLSGKNEAPIKGVTSDGKGQIYRLAEICCVVNAFDNLVFNPFKEVQMGPAEAVKRLILEAGTKYNKNIVQTLLKVVPNYPVGAYIRVTDIVDPHLIGYQGVVAKVNEKNLNKPVIILTKDKFLKKIKPIVIDTSRFTHVELELIL